MWLTKQKFTDFIVILGIVILALALRLWGLSSKEFWYDEAYTGIMLKMPSDKLNELLLFDVHPPIYIHTLRLWTYFVGNSDFNIRLLSVIAGVLLVITSYLLVKSLNISKRYPLARFVIPLVLAVNPFFVEYSKEARSYSLSSLIFSLLFLIYFFAHKSIKLNFKWLMMAIITVVAFLTHYLIAAGLLSLFLFDLFFTKEKAVSFKEYLLKKVLIYTSLGALTLPILYFYLPTLLTQYKNAPQMWWIPISNLQRLPTTIYIFLFGVKANTLGIPQPLQISSNLSPENIGMGLVILFIISLIYTFIKLKKIEIRKEFILLLFLSVLPISMIMILQFFGNRLFLERYLMPYSVVFVILFSLLIFNFKKSIKYLIFGIYMLISISLIFNVSEETVGFEKLAQKLQKVKVSHVQLIMPDPISFTIAKYYLAENKNIEVKIYDPKEDLTDWEIISKDEILKDYTSLEGKQRIWIYQNSDKPDIWYRQSTNFDKLYVYSSIVMFDELAAKIN